MILDRRWVCNCCGAAFNNPWENWNNDGSERFACPKCGSEWLEELSPCEGCDFGWYRPKDIMTHRLCEKCELKYKGELQRFFRGYPKVVREYFDDLLDGTSVEEFV